MASFLSELQAKKELKKVETRDSSGPRLKKGAADISEADIDAYYKTVQEANIETWERHLGDQTFRTVYLAMSVEEARAFLAVTEEAGGGSDAVSDADRQLLRGVETKLQALIDAQPWGQHGVFVKTSSRSAKDAAVARARLVDVYKQKCRELGKRDGAYTVNSKIVALLHAGTQMLRCASARDAMEMLTQSERINQDMRLALEVHARRGVWQQHLAVREWQDIDVSQEWRCFVKARRVTAISQYNYLPHFPDLLAHRDYLCRLLTDYLNDVCIARLPDTDVFQDMVVDLAVTGDPYHSPRIWVIELNPFLSSTDGALFSWSHDVAVLTGQAPMEFRLTEFESAGVKTSMLIQWRELLDSVEID